MCPFDALNKSEFRHHLKHKHKISVHDVKPFIKQIVMKKVITKASSKRKPLATVQSGKNKLWSMCGEDLVSRVTNKYVPEKKQKIVEQIQIV